MLKPGALLRERYCVLRLVGHGAMGAVYEAIDQRAGYTVALKQTVAPDEAAAVALGREAEMLATLRHYALPEVIDSFSDPLGRFLVMSFVPGPTLADLLVERAAPFAAEEVLSWADQILDALEYLHGRQPQVLHLDIKPQNLKQTPQGGVVLLDFGLARGEVLQTRVASRRNVVGYTLPYAPLEQVRGHATDPRSDLFALGSTLYHLLAGRAPPDALERAAARLAGHADPLSPLRPQAPGLPAHTVAAIECALALAPDDRPESAAELRSRLREPVKIRRWLGLW